MKSAPITADLFAGGGGTTCGAEQAGARVVVAVNHAPKAIAVHQRNHPHAEHVCQDAHLVDFTPWWKRLDLLLASPACPGNSTAATNCGGGKRGTMPKHDTDRATALAVVVALEQTRAPVAVIENVEGFRRTWKLYPHWCDMLRTMGYALHEHIVDAADHGVPSDRPRLFITAVRGRTPFVLDLPKVDRVGIGTVFDAKATRWARVDRCGLAEDGIARIARARARHPRGMFVARYVTDDIGRGLDEPIACVTTQHQLAWIRRGPHGDERRMFTSAEYMRAIGFPESYRLTGNVSTDVVLVGNAVAPPVMRAIVTDLVRRA